MHKEDSIPNLKFRVNLIRNNQKVYRLPFIRENHCHIEDGDTIELILLDNNQFSIESYEYPIRYGKYYNNKVFFNVSTDQFNINPKFIFDGVKRVWVLINAGYVCFAEIELELNKRYKIYGEEDA